MEYADSFNIDQLATERMFAHLRHLSHWGAEWEMPLWRLMHYSQPEEMKQQLHEARLTVRQVAGDPDEALGLMLELTDWDYVIHRHFHVPDVRSAQDRFEELEQRLLCTPLGDFSAVVLSYKKIVLRSYAYYRMQHSINVDEVQVLLDCIPPPLRPSLLWYHLGTIGYVTDHLPFVELAYQEQLVNATGWLDDRYWLRTNMMYLILTKRVQKRDILETIRRYEHFQHIGDMKYLFFPKLEKLGMVDEDVVAAYNIRWQELQVLRKELPRLSVRTSGMIDKG
ncbi:MAG: hypothetical protein H7A35_00340 [Planctomycetales bacterium]|nr:hypothetical protein [bacterium]UNM08511.1 MAG: hypothetical protein H7A35_00340 [Planctomycetales bacterium]